MYRCPPAPPRRPLLAAALLLLVPLPTSGQTPGTTPVVAEIPAGARGMALGMAVPVGSNDPDVAFVHPALAGNLRGMQLGTTRFDGPAAAFTLSAATGWFGGGVAVSVHSLDYRRRAPGGSVVGVEGLDGLGDFPESGEGVAEHTATLTYARQVFGIQLGASARLFTVHGGDRREVGESFDLGAATDVGPLDVALTARNLGQGDLPTEYVLGAGGYGQPLGPLDLGVSAQLRYREDREWVYSAGVEMGYWPIRGRTFVGRVGIRNVPEGEASPVTIGGSFWGDALVLDYAFQPVSGGDGIHRFSIGWR